MRSAGKDATDDRPTLLLLDGHSLAFRAFYALPAQNAPAPADGAFYYWAALGDQLLGYYDEVIRSAGR